MPSQVSRISGSQARAADVKRSLIKQLPKLVEFLSARSIEPQAGNPIKTRLTECVLGLWSILFELSLSLALRGN